MKIENTVLSILFFNFLCDILFIFIFQMKDTILEYRFNFHQSNDGSNIII